MGYNDLGHTRVQHHFLKKKKRVHYTDYRLSKNIEYFASDVIAGYIVLAYALAASLIV